MKFQILFLNLFQLLLLTYGLIERYFDITKRIHQAPCMFMELFNFPCPVCGSTRSITHLLNGELILSFNKNPLIITFLVFINFLNVVFLFNSVFKTEFLNSVKITFFKTPYLLIILFLLVISSWINNILQL